MIICNFYRYYSYFYRLPQTCSFYSITIRSDCTSYLFADHKVTKRDLMRIWSLNVLTLHLGRVGKSFTQHHSFFRKLLLYLRKKDVIDLDEFVRQIAFIHGYLSKTVNECYNGKFSNNIIAPKGN